MRKINLPRSRSKFLRKKSTGQSVVEVTMFLPLLIMIVLVVIDFGIVFASYIGLVNAAREGAVFASMYPQLALNPTGFTTASCTAGYLGSPTVSSPPDSALSYTGNVCMISQDNQAYGGGSGVTNTVHIWDEYSNRIQNDVIIVIGSQLKLGGIADVDTLYVDRPILGPPSVSNGPCPTARESGCFITVTVRYQIHTFTSDMSLPGVGRFGLPNYYQINYTVSMPIR